MDFSVIIPIYNAASYLDECLQSVLGQSHTDFELLLINDGSTDASLEICNKFAQLDKRVQVHHQENKGQGSARNLGLREAKGNYILFVDSDDAIAEDTLELNYKILENNPKIECLQFPIYMKYGTPDAYLKKEEEQLYEASKSNIKNLLLVDNVISWIVCDKIFKKESIDRMFFREDIKYEDNYFMMQYIQGLNNFYISEKGIYYYYYREESTTTSEITELKERSTIEVLYLILDFLHPTKEFHTFYKYLVRLINVEKSIVTNFKTEVLGFSDYKKKVKPLDVLKTKLSIKEKVKIFLYKYA